MPERRDESVERVSDDEEALEVLGGLHEAHVLAVAGEGGDDGLGAVHGVHADAGELPTAMLFRNKTGIHFFYYSSRTLFTPKGKKSRANDKGTKEAGLDIKDA